MLALRLYTTAAFVSINNPLRELVAASRVEPHPFPVTVAFISEGIKRLRAIAVVLPGADSPSKQALGRARSKTLSDPSSVATSSPPSSPAEPASPSRPQNDLWRGVKDVHITGKEAFFEEGGIEAAPLSTTSSLQVALAYGISSSTALMRLSTSTFLQRGAKLSYLSTFPQEEEILYPPLTYLDWTYTVITAVPQIQ